MRALKITGIALGVVVVLVILGVVGLVWWVNPNDYRGTIEQLVQQRTGRPLHINGSIGLKVFPWLALRVSDLSLGNPRGYGTQPFLTVKSASIGARLLPLLHKRLQISRVAVDGLTVHLISRGPEANNWRDLASASGSSGGKSGSGGIAAASIGAVDVSDATLIYTDEAAGSTLRLAGLEIHTGALGGGKPVHAKLAFDLFRRQGAAAAAQPAREGPAAGRVAHVALTAQVQASAAGDRVELSDLAADVQWFGADAGSGKAIPITLHVPSLVLDLKAQTLAPTTFDVGIGKLPIQLTASGERLLGERLVSGKITVPAVSPRAVMTSLDMSVPAVRDPHALTKLSLTGAYRLTRNALQLTALDLTLDDTHLRGTAGIDDLGQMATRFDLSIDGIDADRYRPPEAAQKPQQTAASAPVALPVKALRALDTHGSVRIGRIRLAGIDFSQVRLTLDAHHGLVQLSPIEATLYGGTSSGHIVLDARPALPHLALDEKVSDVDIGAFMQAASGKTRLTGRGNASAVLTADGGTDDAMLRSLSGRVDANVKQGAINGVDLWFELRRAWALLKRQPVPVRAAGPARTAFSALKCSATLSKGVATTRDLQADLDYLKVSGQGTLDLTSKAVDYHLVADVYKLPPAGSAGAEMADLKAAQIPIRITGSLDDMKVRPDVEGLIKARVRKAVDQKIEAKKQQLQKKVLKGLEGLFGK